MKYLMGSSGPIADETLGSQVHFPWLPFLSGFWRRLHWAHLEIRDEKSLDGFSHLCPSFALLLLQYNNSILRVAFTCDIDLT